jgi:hypothetical protein
MRRGTLPKRCSASLRRGFAGALIVMVDSTGLGLAGQENMTRLPLCEDF